MILDMSNTQAAPQSLPMPEFAVANIERWTIGTQAIIRRISSREARGRELQLENLRDVIELRRTHDAGESEDSLSSAVQCAFRCEAAHASVLITTALHLVQHQSDIEIMAARYGSIRTLYLCACLVRDGKMSGLEALRFLGNMTRARAQAEYDQLTGRTIRNTREDASASTGNTSVPSGNYDSTLIDGYDAGFQAFRTSARVSNDAALEHLGAFLSSAPAPLHRAIFRYPEEGGGDLESFLNMVAHESRLEITVRDPGTGKTIAVLRPERLPQ